MSDAADVIAKRLTAEIVGPSNSYNGGRLSGDQANGLAYLVVGTLLSQGYGIVKLPEPDEHGRFWFRETCYVYVDPEDGMIMTQRNTTHGFADEARQTAAALIAAANEADQAAEDDLS
jgi:hypothetical protein